MCASGTVGAVPEAVGVLRDTKMFKKKITICLQITKQKLWNEK